MEVLMPSEIARLVFGYLKNEGCDSVAQLFLETSPRLEECRAVVARGKSFNTKISDMSLTDILEKFCMATSIVQEKLSKVGDNELVKKTTDLVDQLRYLLEGKRSQRFVVNINVPPQANQSGDSPIISGSIRKRQHSNPERDRHKRAKIIQQDKSIEQISNQHCDNTEATPLESLPGNSSWNKDDSNKLHHNSSKELFKHNCQSKNDDESNQISEKDCKNLSTLGAEEKDILTKTAETEVTKKCTMGTSTEELLTFANTEVQTMPCDINEPSESEWNDEPIENLSLLTKELLVRTELQERIAENINKVIFPEVATKEDGHCETQGSEANVSLMTELDNAIKTTVAATENDPVFEQFLSEMIGKIEEPDTSPDEESDANKAIPTPTPEKEQDSDEKLPTETEQIDVESTLHHQNAAAIMSIISVNINKQLCTNENENNIESTSEKPYETLAEKLNISIPDMDDNEQPEPENNQPEVDMLQLKTQVDNTKCDTTDAPQNTQSAVVEKVESNNVKPKQTRKRRPRVNKPKEPSSTVKSVIEENILALQTVPTVPTLVYSTKEEAENTFVFNNCNSNSNNICSARLNSLYVPIRPKTGEPEQPTLYLKTVSVPIKVIPPVIPPTDLRPKIAPKNIAPKPLQERTVHKKRTLRSQANEKSKLNAPNVSTIAEEPLAEEAAALAETQPPNIPTILPPSNPPPAPPIIESIEKAANPPLNESLTLYGAENSSGTCLDPENMPILNLDSFCMSTTGFSPLLKFVDKKLDGLPESELKAKDFEKIMENDKAEQDNAAVNFDLIAKRTPMSLRKGQIKTKRLSMSTPRRRSHVRALDFDTPKKSFSTTKNAPTDSIRKRSKSLCRATLFTSPPMTENTSPSPQKLMSAGKEATMSPLPTLSSCWEKYTGMGMILGGVSPKESKITSECQPIEDLKEDDNKTEEENTKVDENNKIVEKVTDKPKLKKRWDADLRDCLNTDKQLEKFKKHFPSNNLETESEVKEKENNDEKNNSEVNKTNDEFDKTVDTVNSSVSLSTSKGSDKKTVKKYAKLKTITTTVTKVISKSIDVSPILDTKVVAAITTPRKLDDNMLLDIPPTPRLHTPGNSTLSNYLKISDDSMKIRNFITTPEIPPTPCIVFTPNPSDKTMDDIRKKDYISTNYYHPSQSRDSIKAIKNPDNFEEKELENPVTRGAEIIQFEVIKENLPKEEAEKELKIATATKDLSMSSDGDTNYVSTTTIVKETLHISHSHNTTASDSDSSDSDSSSSSSSSRSSSALFNQSSSDSSDTWDKTNSPKSAEKKSKTPHKLLPSSITETNSASVKDVSKISMDVELVQSKNPDESHPNEQLHQHESSPVKVFPVFTKTLEEEQETIKETPAKDENEEAVISETPSSSKPVIENTTNLASKISAIIESSKPKVVSIKTVSIPIEPRLIPNISRLESRSQLPVVSPSKKKLQLQLEQKKERMKAALKNNKSLIKPEKPKMHNLMSLKCGKPTRKPRMPTAKNEVEDNKQVTTKVEVAAASSSENCVVNESIEKSESEEKKKQQQPIGKIKSAQKQKIDQVKRDLFSDEESSDKRTTRSSSRRIMDAQKVNPTICIISEEPSKPPVLAPPPSELENVQVPGVLECLQLVPANKNEHEDNDDDVGALNTSQNGVQVYIKMVYDENNCAKKRKRRCSNSDLEIRLADEDGRDYYLRATEYQELFDCTPKPKKRAPQRRATSTTTTTTTTMTTATIKRQRKAPVKFGEDIVLPEILPKPLATSSPAFKEVVVKKQDDEATGTEEETVNNVKEKPKRKRKAKTDENEKIVKKSNFGAPYSEDMLNGVDLENFLDKVHGT